MNFEISHAVDDSDVAFVMRLDRGSTVCSMMNSRNTKLHKVGTNIDAFINLPTLNYLLAGLQLCYVSSHPEKSKWFELLYDLDKYQYPVVGKQLTLWDLRYITRELIVPFGIVRGSEKQGGQDEVGLSAATWPVNFVCNMVLDGHERNVVNYWHYHDISAGDDLVFRLKAMPIPKGKNAYTLNHYYKGFVQHNFETYFQRTFGAGGAGGATHVWQLVPDVFSLDYKPENDERFGADGVRMAPGFDLPQDYVWQEHGYWHVARSQVMVRKYALKEYYNDDMANQLKVNHLDVTFEPAYCKAPGETRDHHSNRMIRVDARDVNNYYPTDQNRVHRIPRSHVAPGMASEAWAPQLRLEELVGSMPVLPEQGGRDAGLDFVAGSEIAAACGISLPRARGGSGVSQRASSRPNLAGRGGSVGQRASSRPNLASRADPEELDYRPVFSDAFPAMPTMTSAAAESSVSEAAGGSAASAGPEAVSDEIDSRPDASEPALEADPTGRKSIGSILASIGGNRGRKRKPQADAPEAGPEGV